MAQDDQNTLCMVHYTHFTRMRTDTDALDFGWMRNAPFKKTCKKKNHLKLLYSTVIIPVTVSDFPSEIFISL